MDKRELSYISPNAKIGKNVEIGPFVTIEDNVEIGDNTVIAILSPAMDTLKEIADNNAIRTLQEDSAAMNALAESSRAIQVFTGVGATIEALHNNSTVRALGEIAMKSAIKMCPLVVLLQQADCAATMMFEKEIEN